MSRRFRFRPFWAMREPGTWLRPRSNSASNALPHLRDTCHDLRQPVAAVLTLATAALTEPTLPVPVQSYLEQIVTQTESLAEIIHHSLSADEPRRPVRLTDLRQLASEAAAAQRVTYRGQLEVLPHAVPLLTHVDRTDVRRIISNLLSNATQAAGPAGTVRIQADRDWGLAQLVVEDTGPGFGQIPEGTGLGWRIIAEGLARCGGKIQFGQSALGGVRARLSLPLAANWTQGEPSQ